jgi:hypothetical protein
MTSSNNTSKVLWKFVNKERGSPNIRTSNILLHVQNEIVTSPSRKCNIFNKTFIETVSKLMLDKKPPQTSNSITNLLEITETELIKIIQSLRNKKSAGLDDITPYLLKKCIPHIIKPLLEL